MASTRKQIAFDLDTNALKMYYPADSWNNAYEVIKKYMVGNGFVWQQGSVYVSQKPTTAANVQNIIAILVKKQPWLNLCMRDCVVTNIGRTHSLNHVFDKDFDINAQDNKDTI